jgi:quercetin dioxygenase-like cupin family protein
MIVKNINEIKGYDVKEAYGSNAKGVTIRWISERRTGGEEYMHHFALRYFVIEPGGYLAPHKHPWEQEIAIVKGMLVATAEGKSVEAKPGDVLYFAANEEHGFKAIGNEPCEFYCVIGCPGKGENCIGLGEPQ